MHLKKETVSYLWEKEGDNDGADKVSVVLEIV